MDSNEQGTRRVAEALAQIHERQERLATGEVAVRRETPPVGAEVRVETRAQVRKAASPPRQRTRDAKNAIVWLTRPLQRWNADGSVAERVGTLEFVRGATLADVRALVEQFYPLPHHRTFEFFHPSLRVRIDRGDEVNIDPKDFDVLAVVALSHAPTAVARVQTSLLVAHGAVETPRGGDNEPAHKVDPDRRSRVFSVKSHSIVAAKDVWPLEERRKIERKPTEKEKMRSIVTPAPRAQPTIAQVQDATRSEVDTSKAQVENEDNIEKAHQTLPSWKDSREKVTTVPLNGTQRLLRKPEGRTKRTESKAIEPKESKTNTIAMQETVSPRVSFISAMKVSGDTLKTDSSSSSTDGEYQAVHLCNREPEVPLHATRIPIEPIVTVYESGTDDHDDATIDGWSEQPMPPLFSPRLEGQTSSDDIFEAPTYSAPVESSKVPVGTREDDDCASELYGEVEQVDQNSESLKVLHDANDLSSTASDLSSTIPPIHSNREGHGHEEISTETLGNYIHVSTERTEKLPTAYGGSLSDAENALAIDLPGVSQAALPAVIGKKNEPCISVVVDPSIKVATTESLDSTTTSAIVEQFPVSEYDSPQASKYVAAVIGYFLEKFEVALRSASPTTAEDMKSTSLFSLAQIQESFKNYGMDHAVLMTNEILLAMEEDVCVWCGGKWEIVENHLKAFLRSLLDRVGSLNAMSQALRELQRFEAGLNFVVDILGWEKPTTIRLKEIESATDSTLEKLGGIGEMKTLILSKDDIAHFGSILRGLASGSLSDFERWLADTLETMYFLLYGALAATETEPGRVIMSREQRIEWVIQKSRNATMWRRLNLCVHNSIDEYNVRKIFQDRLLRFRKGRHHMKKLEEADVIRTIAVFLSRKASEYTRSLTQVIESGLVFEQTQVLQRFCGQMKLHIDHSSGSAEASESHLRDFGLKVTDLVAINKERQAQSLPRLNLSGKLSVLTHHHATLHASAFRLHKRARWSLPEMQAGPIVNRYTYHGDTSVALEFVYVKHSLDIEALGSRWEDSMRIIEAEAAAAFQLFGSSSSAKKKNILLGIGFNVLHTSWLHDSHNLDSLRGVLRAHPNARKLSVGYHLSRNEAVAAIRITYRVHTDPPPFATDGLHGTEAVLNVLDKFICSATNEALHRFLRFGGLQYIVGCLQENCEKRWVTLQYGNDVRRVIADAGSDIRFPRLKVLLCIQSLLYLIPQSDTHVTPTVVTLLEELTKLGNDEAECAVAEAATRSFVSLSGLESPESMAGVTTPREPSAVQKAFLAVDGLCRLKGAIDAAIPFSTKRELLEDALLSILTTTPFCTQEGLLVHAADWMIYLIESQAWSRSPWHESVLRNLLAWLHVNFFTTKHLENDRVVCGCGCRGSTPGQFSALTAVAVLYSALMRTKPGRVWAHEELTGPLDLLNFIEWTCTRREELVDQTTNTVVIDTLFVILSDNRLSRDMWSRVSSILGAKIIHVVQLCAKDETKLLLLDIWGLLFDGGVKYSTWEVAPKQFLSFVLALINAMSSGGGSGAQISLFVTDLIIRQEVDVGKIDHRRKLSSYLVKEHEQCATSNNTRNSILHSITRLLSIACQVGNGHPSWLAPLLVGLATLIENTDVVLVLESLGLEEALHTIMITEGAAGERILAERALAIFYTQMLQSGCWNVLQRTEYSRICNILSSDVQSNMKRSFPRLHAHIHVGDNGIPLYGKDIQDISPLLRRFSELLVSDETPRGCPVWERAYLEEVWRDHYWLHDGSVERIIAHMKLLVVFTYVPQVMELQQIKDEMSVLLRSLCKFIRDRSHIPEYQVLLYICVIDNLSAFYRNQVQEFDVNSLLDARFFERLLLYSRRPDTLLSMAAARCLWSLASAFQDRDIVFKQLRMPMSMIDDDEVGTAASPTLCGIDVLIDNITSRLSTKDQTEGSAGTLSVIVEHNSSGAQYFLTRYRLATVTKFLNEARLIRISQKSHPFTPMRLRSGPHVYEIMVTRSEKDMIQLCRLARCCLSTIARSEATKQATDQANAEAQIVSHDRGIYFKLDVEFSRIKSSIVPLLFDDHPLIIDEAVRSILIPLVAHPLRSADVLDAPAVDRLLHLALHHDYSTLQARALSATRAAVGNSKMFENPFRLSEKLFAEKAALAMCLNSENFEVTKQAIELMAFLISRNDEPSRRYEFAALFRTESHQRALVHALAFLCQSESHHDAGFVLQRFVSFIIQLQLVRLIDSDLMVEAMSMAISSHREHAFLRPMMCGCLRDIALQPGKSIHFVNQNRLDPILSLLHSSLSNGEARDIVVILRALASENQDIREYLRKANSQCVQGIAVMMSSFTRVSAENLSHKPLRRILAIEFDPDDLLFEDTQDRGRLQELEDGRQAIRTAIDSHTFISAFADDVYEEALHLLLVLLSPYEFAEERYGCTCSRGCDSCDPCDLFAIAHGPRAVCNLLFACRVLTHVDDTNQRLIQAAAVEAFTIVRLALHVLRVLSTSHNCRTDIMSDPVTGHGESTLVWLMNKCRPNDMREFHQVAELTDNALQALAHCCAESNAARIVFSYQQFTISLFNHLLIRRDDPQALPCQRTATFFISRLAENRKYLRHPLFQEKVWPVLARIDEAHDTVTLSNLLILSRNAGERLPNNRLFDVVMRILRAAKADANASTLVACELLACLLLVRSSCVHHKAYNTPALSQTKKRYSCIGPFRLTTTPICSFLYRRLRTDFESREYVLLIDEAGDFASQIWPSDDVTDALEAMLDFLVVIHLGGKTDSIEECTFDNRRVRTHTPSLQYIASTADQNALEPPDSSFAGTAQLWRFIRKLWHTCNTKRLLSGKRQPKPHLERIVTTFQRWGARPVTSVSSLERRQRLVGFTNVLLTANPESRRAFRVNETAAMLEDFVARFGSIGDGYELLHILCKADPANAACLVDRITEGASKVLSSTPDRDRSCSQRQLQLFARKLWTAIRPRYYVREAWVSKGTSKNPRGEGSMATPDAAFRGIEVSGPGSSTELAFAVAMLNTLTRHNTAALTSYFKSHSIHVLLDMLLVTLENDIELTTAHHVWVSNLLEVIASCVTLDVNVIRLFIADPRLLGVVVRQVHSTNIDVQGAGLELLNALTNQNTDIVCLLRRAEDWTKPSCCVESWMISIVQLRLARLRVHGVHRSQITVLAHLLQVPIFSRVKTLDLARVSMAFGLSGLVERGHFMVLTGNCQFDPPPDWLNTKKPADFNGSSSQREATLSRTVEAKKSSGQRVALFEASKERFFSRSTLEARSAISHEIVAHYSHPTDVEDKTSPLVRRLCRFLVEDRAELLRRVMYVKRLELGVAAASLPTRWNDVLRLLSESPLMKDVPRDSLACLALSLSEPVKVCGESIFQDPASTWKLYILHTESITYKVQAPPAATSTEESTLSVRKLNRGDIVVPAMAVAPTMSSVMNTTAPRKISAWEVTQAQLETSLSAADFALIRERVTELRAQDAEAGINLGGSCIVQSKRQQSSRLCLQLRALTLLKSLVEQSETFAYCLANDQKAMVTLVQISRSCLCPSVIQLALNVLVALVVALRDPAFLTRVDLDLRGDTDHEAFTSEKSGVLFAIVAVRGALQLERELVSSLRLMRAIVEAQDTSWNNEVSALVIESMSLVLTRVLEADPPHASEVVEEALVMISKMIESQPQAPPLQLEGNASSLPHLIAQLLPQLSTLRVGPGAFAALLQAIVFFDQDVEWKNIMHSHIISDKSQFVLKTIAADLLVQSRGVTFLTGTTIDNYLTFIETFSSHVLEARVEESLTYKAVELVDVARVLLTAFSRLNCPHHVLLRVIGMICEAEPICARIAASAKIAVSKRIISFHRFVYAFFQSFPPSHTWRRHEEVVSVVRCVRVLSSFARAARHFVSRGFVDLGMNYLGVRATEPTRLVAHAIVSAEIFLSFKAIVKAGGVVPGLLLRDHGQDLREFLERIPSIADSLIRSQLLTVFLDTLTTSIDASTKNEDSLADVTWLITDVAAAALGSIHSRSQEETLQRHDRTLVVASLSFLCAIGRSAALVKMIISSSSFSSQVETLCSDMSMPVLNMQARLGFMRFLCLVTERLTAEVALCSDDLLAVLVQTLLPAVNSITTQTVETVEPDSLLPVSLRVEWLVLYLALAKGFDVADVFEAVIPDRMSTLQRVAQSKPTVRTIVNTLGLVATVARLLVHRTDATEQACERIVDATFVLISTNKDAITSDVEVTPPRSWGELGWNVFCYHFWGDESPSLRFELHQLVVISLRRIISHTIMASAWVKRDPHLDLLRAVGLPVALRLLGLRAPVGRVLFSVMKKCVVFIHEALRLVTNLLGVEAARVCRRTLRQGALIDSIVWCIQTEECAHEVVLRGITLLATYVSSSIPNCMTLWRYCREHDINVFALIVTLVLREVHSTHPRRWMMITACLSFMEEATRSVYQIAVLAAVAINDASVFISKLCDRSNEGEAYSDAVHALFRSISSVLHHVKLKGENRITEVVICHISSLQGPDSSAVWIVAAFCLIADLTTDRVSDLPLELLDVDFWKLVDMELRHRNEVAFVDSVCRLCTRVLKARRAREVFMQNTPLREALAKTILTLFAVSGNRGASVVIYWLRLPLAPQSEFVRAVCDSLSNIKALPASQQVGLVLVLPSLVTNLKSSNRLDRIDDDQWLVVRDLGLQWAKSDGQSLLLRASCSAFRSLLMARRIRTMHDAAAGFRAVCAQWRVLHDMNSLSGRLPDTERVGSNEAAPAETIDIMVTVSSALGLTLDHDAVLSSAIALWLWSSCYAEGSYRQATELLDLVYLICVDDTKQARPTLVGAISSGSDAAAQVLARIISWRGEVESVGQRLVSSILRSNTGRAVMRPLLVGGNCDIIDRWAWDVYNGDEKKSEPDLFASRIESVTLLCADSRVAERVLRRRVLDEWVCAVAYCDDHNSYLFEAPVNQAMLALASTVLRHVSLDQDQRYRAWKPLIMYAVHCLLLPGSQYVRLKSHALELLTALVQVDHTMTVELWRACHLTNHGSFASEAAQGVSLRAITELLCTGATTEDRRRAAFVVYSLSTSPMRITPLIRARELVDDGENVRGYASLSLCGLLTRALFFSVGTRIRHTLRTNPREWTSTASIFPLPVEFTLSDTAVWVLRLLHNCLRDKSFTRALAVDINVFEQVFAAVACPAVEVSALAAHVLRDAVVRPTRASTPSRRQYRQLDFFSDLRAHDAIATIVPTGAAVLPTCFTVLELWIRYYGHHVGQIEASNDSRGHLQAILEVVLCILRQHFAQVFRAPDDSAERDRHTELCKVLTHLVCSLSSAETHETRLLLLEVLTALCAFASTQYSVDFFVDTTQLDRLLQVIEMSSFEEQRVAVVGLVRELAWVGSIKALIGHPSSVLLCRVVAWLGEGGCQSLQVCATTIIRYVVAKSTGVQSEDPVMRKEALEQHQLMLHAVADAIFVSRQHQTRDHRVQSRDTATTRAAEARVEIKDSHLRDEKRTTAVVLHLSVLDRHRICLREFRYRGKLRLDRPVFRHELVLEDAAAILKCELLLPDQKQPRHTVTGAEQVAPHRFSLDLRTTEPVDVAFPPVATLAGERLQVALHHYTLHVETNNRGVLGRLLADQDVKQQVVTDALAIITELAKNHAVFCRPDVSLGRHMLAAVEASFRRKGQLDLAPFNALTVWFWSKTNSVAHFRTSSEPLLWLFQHMRNSVLATACASTHDMETSASVSGPTFLASLVDWLATLESESLTDNCINALFFENRDILMALATHFFPQRSARTSFFHLAAMVVRVNRVHCEVFSRRHALQTLMGLLDDTGPDPSRPETLRHAARVVAKIARSYPAGEMFQRHGGMRFFGRIAFAVLCEEDSAAWDASPSHLRAAAENLVLAASCFCEAAVSTLRLPEKTTSQRATLETWARCDSDLGKMQTRLKKGDHMLSLVETLLVFLAVSDKCRQRRGSAVASSVDRLAAVVLRALIEKWPSRSHFEHSLVIGMHNVEARGVQQRAQLFELGLRRCIQLTQWDFYSQLHIVRRTYSSAVSSGVRTGVIPTKCRNILQPFDADFLDELRKAALVTSYSESRTNSRQAGSQLALMVNRDAMLDHERAVVDEFVRKHALLVETLGEHRKKTLTSRIRKADGSARVALGVHAVFSVVHDAFVDAVEAALATPGGSHRMTSSQATSIMDQWLLLLEQLFGLLCCSFNELDAVYYGEVFRQMHVLLASELPAFLLKMERVQSRHETITMVLNNLERLLRRLTNKHELRGVTSTGVGVSQDAKKYMDDVAAMKDKVSEVLGVALSCRDGVDRLQRGIVAAEYAWRRVFSGSGDSITAFMEGRKDSESLWVQIRGLQSALMTILMNPGPVLRTRWEKLQNALASLVPLGEDAAQPLDRSQSVSLTVEADVVSNNSPQTNDEDESHDKLQQERDKALVAQLGLASMRDVLTSGVPHVSLESLLDHYGYASSGVKKQIALLNVVELRPLIVQAFADALEREATAVASMQASQLEYELRMLQSKALRVDGDRSVAESAATRLAALFQKLRDIVDDADLGVQLRVIVEQPTELSFWQFLVAPVLRARLFLAFDRLIELRQSSDGRRAHALEQAFEHSFLRNDVQPLALVASTAEEGPTGELPLVSKSSTKPNSKGTVHRWTLPPWKVAAGTDDSTSTASSAGVEGLSKGSAVVVDGVEVVDPLSDESLIQSLKRELENRRQRQLARQASLVHTLLGRVLPSAARYSQAPSKVTRVFSRVKRRLALLALLLAFWRQEELAGDLRNEVYAKAFSSHQEREQYFLSRHLRKAFAELIRVWMPESGTLGLSLWHWRSYGVCGTLLCVVLACVSPHTSSNDTYKNDIMTWITYSLVIMILLLSAKSMSNIADKQFVLQERSRLRLQPIGTYYQNLMAIKDILVDVVQLNSITFDPTFDWNKTDQVPKFIQLMGDLGISRVGIAQVELKAAFCAFGLGLWFILLKCANKFQESSPSLNRRVTKDLPSLLNGTLYMGFIATFFSFLSCVDCSRESKSSPIDKCKNAIMSGVTVPPFLLSHQNIACWTHAHVWYAFLGFWGVAFFMPIGLLSEGMNQVLFEEEALDIKFAPVIKLFSQLIKAASATAHAFFPFNKRVLASLALLGNMVLFAIMMWPRRHTKIASLWYIQYVEGGIYAASAWSAGVAIYRIETGIGSSEATNLVYMGWLGIGAVTAMFVRWHAWLKEKEHNKDSRPYLSSQRELVAATGLKKPSGTALTTSEKQFLEAAAAVVAAPQPTRQVQSLLEHAARLSEGHPPQLHTFIQRARAYAGGQPGGFGVSEAVFIQNSRRLARKMEARTTSALVDAAEARERLQVKTRGHQKRD